MTMNFQIFLTLSLMMSFIIFLLFAINTIFAKKISAKIRYFMWVVIMIGLLIPFRPTFGGGIIDIPNFTTAHPESAGYSIPESGAVVMNPSTPTDIPQQNIEINEQISFQVVALVVWATVAIGIVGYHLFQYNRFQRSIKRWGEPEEDLNTLELFERIRQEMNLANKNVKLVVCGFVTTSMLTGLFKPVVLLPERNYDDDELELIFRHELIHYQRKDLWIKLLSVIAIAIHWFNPLVYLMNIALQSEGEASCDQKVLEISELKNRHFYAEVIIGMIGGKKSGMTILATNFYSGKKGIKKRLEEIMVGTTPRKSTSYMCLLLVLMLTVMSGSVFAMQTPTYTEENSTELLRDENADSFELAINAIGGGLVIDYLQFSHELMFVFVAYADVVYLIEIDMINNSVIGLEIHHENEIHTEADTESAQEEPETSETSREQAGELALALVPNGILIEIDNDFERGRAVWYVAIRDGNTVHEIYVDRENGSIVLHETYRDD